jgi:hypothetical protein
VPGPALHAPTVIDGKALQAGITHVLDADTKQGQAEQTRLITAIHSNNLGQMKTALNATHQKALGDWALAAYATHDKHLTSMANKVEALNTQLVQHEMALAEKTANAQIAAAKAAKAAAQTANETRRAGEVSQAEKITTDIANNTAQAIGDATTVAIDRQHEAGLTGTALTAAQAQTSYDTIVGTNNAAIGAAQQHLDATPSTNPLAVAIAQKLLDDAKNTATVQEAQAKATLDLASAANTMGTAATTLATAAAATPAQINVGPIYGGNATPQELAAEIAWSITIGATPIAA